jgi:transcriptional regulator with XRE-family HTH domain
MNILMDSERLGQRLKAIREVFKLSQNDVAEKLGVNKINIVRLEKGSVRSDFLLKALGFYGQYISLDRLFNEKMSILECLQEEIASPTGELVKNRVSLVRENVNELFEDFRKEQNQKMDDILRRFNAKMDAVDD